MEKARYHLTAKNTDVRVPFRIIPSQIQEKEYDWMKGDIVISKSSKAFSLLEIAPAIPKIARFTEAI